jgi:hypothetical protein
MRTSGCVAGVHCGARGTLYSVMPMLRCAPTRGSRARGHAAAQVQTTIMGRPAVRRRPACRGGGASCHSPIGQPRAHIMDVLLGAQTRLPPALHMSRRHRQPAPREAPRVSPGAQVASYRPLVIRGPRKRPQPISRPLRSLHGLCPSLAFPPTIFLRNPQRATPKLFKTSGIYSLP